MSQRHDSNMHPDDVPPQGKYPWLVEPRTIDEVEDEEFEQLMTEVSGGQLVYDGDYSLREVGESAIRQPEEYQQYDRPEPLATRHLDPEWVDILEERKKLYSAGFHDEEDMLARAEFEQVLLTLQEQGENMTEIARALGWHIKPTSGRSEAMARALKRARKARGET